MRHPRCGRYRRGVTGLVAPAFTNAVPSDPLTLFRVALRRKGVAYGRGKGERDGWNAGRERKRMIAKFMDAIGSRGRRPRAWGRGIVTSLLLIGTLAMFAPVTVSATSGYDSVDGASVNPLSGGGYTVHVHAYATFDFSIGVADAPDPSIDWGDGTSTNADFKFCTTFFCSGGDLSGTHTYPNYGTYGVRLRYYTGCCVSYDATWDVTIPRTTDTINLSTAGAGASTIVYSPAGNSGGTVCPPDCAPQFPAGTVVTLTPTAGAGSVFEKYIGTFCGKGGCTSPCSVNPCTLTMPEDFGYATDVKASFAPTDTTAPVITASATTTGDNKPYTAGTWTNQSVTVAFSCADGGTSPSGIATNTVAGATVSTEGAAQSVTNTGACVDNAGNTANAVTFGPIKIDTTNPAITGSAVKADATPYTPNTWTNQSVTVSFTCADTGTVQSGIGTNTVAGATISADTTSQSVTNTGACVDNAGNAAPAATVGPIKVDKTKPVITGSATTADGTPYTAGTWTNQNVTVAFACADSGAAQSGLATNTVGGGVVTSETASQTVTNSGLCVDNAGNSADPATFVVKIDKTKPVITAKATTADGKPYAAGTWTNQNVTVAFACADGGSVPSGIAANTLAGATVSSQGANLSVTNTGKCTDNAGNTADPVTFGPIKIDKTPPTVTGAVTPGSIWPPDHKFVPITATVNVGDSASGPATFVLVSATASGDASDIEGFTVGQASTSGQVRANKDEVYTLTYQGKDTVGNSATLVLTVAVPHDQGH
jgi:hypothetical protein